MQQGKTISTFLNPEEHEQLGEVAKAENVSKSKIVYKAIQEYVKSKAQTTQVQAGTSSN